MDFKNIFDLKKYQTNEAREEKTSHNSMQIMKLYPRSLASASGRITTSDKSLYAPVICIPGSLGAGDSGDIAGPKCRDLTFDESRQCRRCAKVLISRQNANLCHILTTRGSSVCTFAQSDQLLFRCLDEHASWNRKYGC